MSAQPCVQFGETHGACFIQPDQESKRIAIFKLNPKSIHP